MSSLFTFCTTLLFSLFCHQRVETQKVSVEAFKEATRGSIWQEAFPQAAPALGASRSLLGHNTSHSSLPCFQLVRTFPYLSFLTTDLPLTTSINASKSHYFTRLQGSEPTLRLLQLGRTNDLLDVKFDDLKEKINLTLSSRNFGTYLLLWVAENDCGQAIQVLHVCIGEAPSHAIEEELTRWCRHNTLARKIALPVALTLPLLGVGIFLFTIRKRFK